MSRLRLDAIVVVLVSTLALGPALLHRGYLLVGDMTFVPDQPWKPAWLGLDGSVPRAVPADAIVSLLGHAIAGDLLQKAVLLAILVCAGLGTLGLARRVLPGSGAAPRLGAAVLYVWNPYVYERLAIGHWGLLVGYAVLPWVVVVALDVRRSEPGDHLAGQARLVLLLAAAAFGSPTGGLLAGLVALVVVVGRDRTRAAAVAAATLVVNLPWLVPGVLNDGVPSDRAGVTAFAARADTPLGTLGSLLTFGGIWKDAAAPAERDSVLLVLAALVLVLLSLFALIGTSWVRTTGTSGPGRPLTVRLATLATLSLLISGLPTTGPGSDLVGWLVVHVSGAGLWRDSQKLLAPFVLVAALGFAALLELVGRRLRDQGLGAATGALALVPIMLLPSLAWGLSGRFEPVTYPAEWHAVRAILEQQPVDQRRTMVLPWSAYQRLPWNGRRAALDPALRFFPGDVVTSDDLAVSDTRTVPGEDATAARIGAAIAHGEPLTAVLRSAGVRYVLVEKTASGAADVPSPAGIVLHDGPQLSLVDLGPGARPHHSVERAAILAADALTGVAFLGALVLLIRRRAGVRIGYHARGRSGNGGRAADYR